MNKEHLSAVLFLLVTAVFVYLFYRIIIPFFVPLAWAAVLVILFHPLYTKLLRKTKLRGLSSLIMTTLVLVLIVGPISYLFVALVNEAAVAVDLVNEAYKRGELDKLLSVEMPWISTIQTRLEPYYDLSQVNLEEIAKNAIDGIGGVVLNQTRWLLTNATMAIFYFILMIFTMYYFFRDGHRLVNRVKRLMPLPPERVGPTFDHLRDVIQATMYGGGVVALVQGFLGGLMFWLVGISSPVFWGAMMAFLSAIPFVGAFVVYIPAGIILMLGGSYVKGIIVIVIGSVVVSQIDNVLRPYLISGRTHMHPLLLFFSIMGGIAMFGLLGLVMGPLIAAAFDTLVKAMEFRLRPDLEGRKSA